MAIVGIIAKQGRSLTITRSQLAQNPKLQPLLLTDPKAAVEAVHQNRVDALVLIVEQFTIKSLQLIQKIRGVKPHIPIVFVTEKSTLEAERRLELWERTMLMSIEDGLTDLPGIIEKMHSGVKVVKRASKRKTTLQIATVLPDEVLQVQGCLLDLAQAGARLRSFHHELKIGSRVKIKIPLTFLKKEYEAEAEVVWSQPEHKGNEFAQSWLSGLKFVSVHG